MLSVKTNIQAWNAERQFGTVSKKNAKSTEKLSSGYRINRAADDAAGLAISERMRRQIRGLTQASNNAQDGISMVQTAEGALNEVHDMLHRANELSVKAATGTLTDADRALIDLEVQQIKKEIDKTAQNTVFNEIRLFPEDGLTPSAMQSEIYYYDLTYNLSDGTFSVNPSDSSLLSVDGATERAAGAMGRAAVNPTPSGGALANLLATDLIPKAAQQIIDAFPSIKNDIGSVTLNLAVKVQKIDGKDKTLAQAYFTFSKSGGRPKVLELRVDNQDFTLADAQGTGDRAEVLQSTIAHELMHTFMQYSMTDGMSGRNGSSTKFPEWFTEGTAQLAGGGFPTNWNNTLIAYAKNLTDEDDSSQDANMKAYLKKYTPANRPYGHGYLAAAYAGWLANGGGDVTSDNIAAGMDKIFADLINGSSLNAAIQKHTGLSASTLTSRITSGSGGALEFVRKLTYNSLGGAGSVITSSLKVSGVLDGTVGGSSSGGNGGGNTPARPIGDVSGSKMIALQVGADAGQHIDLSLYQMSTHALGLSDTNVKTTDDADMAIDAIKAAIEYVSNVRSDYGAVQNRLEHTINNLNNIMENTTAAEARIRDTDIAEEMVLYSNNQILMQAGASVLSQANQHSEMILSLLG